MMIQWDLWQFQNQVLHLPTGPIAITSHHSLNYQISEETAIGTDGIAKSNYHLFSVNHSVTKFHAGYITTKTNWLEMVHLACAEYEEPDSDIICQAISQHKQMQDYLLRNGPLLPVPAH